MHPYTNGLIHETSPYLLQHAHNPVNWHPWNEEAFAKAKREDKPVLVSIGYAACHWCHVMEKESFEDPEVAAVMNEHFINIKVDREERPDVDQIYMDAVQAISGSGGWPLNVFLTPEGKPFYGGTYYPPRRAFNRPSWTEILLAIHHSYKGKKEEINAQANTLTEHLKASNAFGKVAGTAPDFTGNRLEAAARQVLKLGDREWGGFGKAPKFPQTFSILFLLRYAHLTGNEGAKSQALLTLDKMMEGGIYDQIGGGFARYSTDREWLAPHFEKMLYDNALMVSALSEAYQFTQNKAYKTTIEETLAFIERELMHPDGGFYSALDADSEGEEGKFYVWDINEIKKIIGENADLFCAYFDIREGGNWEGKSIPRLTKRADQFIKEQGLQPESFHALIKEGKEKVLRARNKRVRPALDDKLLLGWNALMNRAYGKAYEATGNEHYREVAVKNMNFLFARFRTSNGTFYHTWKADTPKYAAFLDDYSYLIAALLELATITWEVSWLEKAVEIVEVVMRHFPDSETPLFFYTPDFQKDIILRRKEVYDGATPSGNGVMATNLYHLAILFDREDWREKSHQMLSSFAEAAVKYPTSFGVWLLLLTEVVYGTNEIAVIGHEAKEKAEMLLKEYIPHKIIMAAAKEMSQFPLLKDKKCSEQTLFFLCKNYACRQPVNTIAELKHLINQNNSVIVQ